MYIVHWVTAVSIKSDLTPEASCSREQTALQKRRQWGSQNRGAHGGRGRLARHADAAAERGRWRHNVRGGEEGDVRTIGGCYYTEEGELFTVIEVNYQAFTHWQAARPLDCTLISHNVRTTAACFVINTPVNGWDILGSRPTLCPWNMWIWATWTDTN